MTKGFAVHLSTRIGIVISGAAFSLVLGLAAPVASGAATPTHAGSNATVVLLAPHGSYHLFVYFHGGVAPFTFAVTPGACSATGCVGTWTPDSGTSVGTYLWHASDGSVAFVLGQDHFYGRTTTSGINSLGHMGKLMVNCPNVGVQFGTWYAISA